MTGRWFRCVKEYGNHSVGEILVVRGRARESLVIENRRGESERPWTVHSRQWNNLSRTEHELTSSYYEELTDEEVVAYMLTEWKEDEV